MIQQFKTIRGILVVAIPFLVAVGVPFTTARLGGSSSTIIDGSVQQEDYRLSSTATRTNSNRQLAGLPWAMRPDGWNCTATSPAPNGPCKSQSSDNCYDKEDVEVEGGGKFKKHCPVGTVQYRRNICESCVGFTAGPCKGSNGVCWDYLPGTTTCPATTTPCPGPRSCVGQCGHFSCYGIACEDGGCWCDDHCVVRGDCCFDKVDVCPVATPSPTSEPSPSTPSPSPSLS